MPSQLPFQRVLPSGGGLVPSYTTADVAGHLFYNHGGTLLHVLNASGAPVTATVHFNAWALAHANESRHVSIGSDSSFVVPAGGASLFGPFPYQDFNEPDDATTRDPAFPANYDDTCLVTFSAIAGVSLAAIILDESLVSATERAPVTGAGPSLSLPGGSGSPLTVQPVTYLVAAAPTFTAADPAGHRLRVPSGSSDWPDGGPLIMWLRNTSGVPVTVTWTSDHDPYPPPPWWRHQDPVAFSVGPGESRIYGPVLFLNQRALDIAYSATSGVSIAIVDAAALRRTTLDGV